MQIALVFALVCSLMLPATSYAQTSPTDPGQDVFGGSAGNNALFEGYNAQSPVNTLFNGDTQQANGMFTTPPTQLGGATPYLELIKPEQTNKGNPSFIVLTSKYTPTGDLTSSTTITLTVNVHNVGKDPVTGIKLIATLQDKNATLVNPPAPTPPFDAGSSIDAGLTWSKLAGNKPFDLQPDQSADFSWSFKANKDDSILRWRFVAQFGAGESILLQWIPIKNPNPQAGGANGNSSGGSFSGNTCGGGAPRPFPTNESPDQIVADFKTNWGFTLVDGDESWKDPQYLPVVKIWWSTLAEVDCTPYLKHINQVNAPGLSIMATSCIGSNWGEFKLDCYPAGQAINIANQLHQGVEAGIPHTVEQNIIHELGHAYSADRGSASASYYNDYLTKLCQGSLGGSCANPISYYGTVGGDNENWADSMGFYVARCAQEVFYVHPSKPNPYSLGHDDYFEWIKTNIFGGQTYGPTPPGTPSNC